MGGITGPVKFGKDGKRTGVEVEILNLRNNSFVKVSSKIDLLPWTLVTRMCTRLLKFSRGNKHYFWSFSYLYLKGTPIYIVHGALRNLQVILPDIIWQFQGAVWLLEILKFIGVNNGQDKLYKFIGQRPVAYLDRCSFLSGAAIAKPSCLHAFKVWNSDVQSMLSNLVEKKVEKMGTWTRFTRHHSMIWDDSKELNRIEGARKLFY